MSRQSIGSNYSVEERNEMIIDIETKIQKQMHALVDDHSRKNWKKLFALFQERDEMVISIPDFWFTVIQCEDRILRHFSDMDFEMLNSFDDLQLSLLPEEMIIRVDFKFRSNPYFHNHVITRKYSLKMGRLRLSTLTPINWKKGHEPTTTENDKEEIKQKPSLSFFHWLSSVDQFDQMGIWIITKMYPSAYNMFARAETSDLGATGISSCVSEADISNYEKTPCDTITEQP